MQPHRDRGKARQPSLPSKPATPSLFDATAEPDSPAREQPEAAPATKVYCSWCGDPCPPGKLQCDEFCARMENRKPAVVFPGNQDPEDEECTP
jgi:hypothetical protein